MNFRANLLSVLVFLCTGLILSGQTGDIKSMEAAAQATSGKNKIEILIQLADAYLVQGNTKEAGNKAEEAEKLARKNSDVRLQAMALNRQAHILEKEGKYAKAWKRYEESNKLASKLPAQQQDVVSDNLAGMKLLAPKVGKTNEVAGMEKNLQSAAGSGASELPEGLLTTEEFRAKMAGLNHKVEHLAHSTDANLAKETQLLLERKELQAELIARNQLISKMNEEQMKTALMYMEQRSLLDSLIYKSDIDSLALAQTNAELNTMKANRNFYIAAALALFLLAGGLTFSFVRARQHAAELRTKNAIIREEQNRSEKLLLNILPALVADELKKRGRTEARFFDDVSVLFADFVGFSKIAEKLSPQQLVGELDACFHAFDEIISKHNLEKIKTIGDAYMCAGGLPHGGGAQLKAIVAAAIEMQAWLNRWNADREKQGMPRYDARIGIHRGPVVAGVVGSRKFAFDIWGDTVNIAARIEQAGEGGKINISGEVFKIVSDYYTCTYRGKIAAKNKGEIDMYFVEN
ncbi:MAG: adenylate/guanylate cyclase domain-containing protein [Saprospiraceae bacterium]|nr:adenylate/guanylate cyclase domain-containing protein [Saprospiraceae bacterium]